MRETPIPGNDKLLYRVDEAVTASGVGRTNIYALIKEGKLDARKFGGRTLITAESLRRFAESLPPMKAGAS